MRWERGGWVLAGAQVLRWFTHAQNPVQTIPVHVQLFEHAGWLEGKEGVPACIRVTMYDHI